jgi:multidrug efflux pump subunit AcrA (membrane-fusion protein)
MYIMPSHKYTITADIEKAYNSSETKYVNIGETVYIACTAASDHAAVGVVTAASGNTYTVETVSGTLMMEETVNIYRTADYAAKSRIGRGTVGRTQEISVGGSGSILKLHVKDGDLVERGQLLFETVTGALDGLFATDNEILSDVAGVIATVNTSAGANVNKGDTLLTVYTMDTLQIEISVNEYDLISIAEGDEVEITFNYDPDQPTQMLGKVSMISHLSTSQDSEASYLAYVDFVPNENVRIGMTAVVATIDKPAEE